MVATVPSPGLQATPTPPGTPAGTLEQPIDSDPEHLRALARDLLAHPADAKSADAAAQILQRAAEIENQRAEAAKSRAELEKLRNDLANSSSNRTLEAWKSFTSILAPLFTTVLLVVTLFVQTWQFKKQRDGAAEEAEDKRWSEAIKVIADRQELSPTGTLLATFRQSKRYGGPARDLAVQQLTRSKSIEEFSSCLALFEPFAWSDLEWIMEANRSIVETYRRLDNKTLVKETGKWDLNLITDEERKERSLAEEQVAILSAKVGSLFKGPPPESLRTRNLNGAWFWRADWKGVNLNGADLTNFYLYAIDLEGVDLSGITRFQYAKFDQCAWWMAAKISPPLLDHLLRTSPYRTDVDGYGSDFHAISKADYESSLQKLKKASSIA